MKGAIDNLGKSPENANSDTTYGNEENHSFLENNNINNFLKYGLYYISHNLRKIKTYLSQKT